MAIVAVAALLPATATASAATYMVRDASGWPRPGSTTTPGSATRRKVGDTLVFRYTVAEHDVVPVDALDYAGCKTPQNAEPRFSGDTHVVLGQAGQFYFICDAEGQCVNGMKLAINVVQ